MAKCGNHGIVIPRDAALLSQLYWIENKTLPEIGALFGVTHKSVERVFRELGIPRRRVGTSRVHACIQCGAPVQKIAHRKNGSKYGRRCKEHQREHKAKLQAIAMHRPHIAEYRKKYMAGYYDHGPNNPKGEAGWINKGKGLLRKAKRLLRGTDNRAV